MYSSILRPRWCVKAAEKWEQTESCRRHQHPGAAKTKHCISLMKVVHVSSELLQSVVKGNPIKVGQEEFEAHMLPTATHGMLQMEISLDSKARLHILMTQMAMLGFKPMQVESILLHMIHEGMGTMGQKIWDIYIDREGTAIIDKNRGNFSK